MSRATLVRDRRSSFLVHWLKLTYQLGFEHGITLTPTLTLQKLAKKIRFNTAYDEADKKTNEAVKNTDEAVKNTDKDSYTPTPFTL